MAIAVTIEDRTREIGREIFERVKDHRRGFFHHDLDSRLMDWAMRDEKLKTQLFRFVDVLPTLRTPEEVVKHLREYLGGPDLNFPAIGQWGINLAATNPIAARAAAATVEHQVGAMAKRFIAGSNVKEVSRVITELRGRRMAFTLDILGEVAVSEEEAEGYQKQYLELIRGISEQAAHWAKVPLIDFGPKVNVSVKLSSLYSQIEIADPDGSTEAIKARLRPILDLAMSLGAFIHIDMEHYAIKDLTLRVFREILTEPAYRDSDAYGITIQAYLRDSEADLRSLIDWTKERGAPVQVRLVRGAYWDYETVIARQRHWPVPVYTQKHETDANYENLTRMLIESYPVIGTAIGTHNIRSIAYAMALAESVGMPAEAVEYQMLYGMGDPLKGAVVDLSRRLRVYTPYGELIPGMAYLVRRLLENTSNESFLRQSFVEKVSLDDLLKSPQEAAATAKLTPEPPEPDFVNEPERDFSKEEHRRLMREALVSVRSKFGATYPLIIGGKETPAERYEESRNPSNPSEVVGMVASATVKEAQAAIEAAMRAFPAWRDTPGEERARYLFKAAEILRSERDEMAAWEVYETGKGWREADADVCETIDYLEYYGREMVRLSKPRRLGPVPGEVNDYFYQPKGVAAIIPPWNFPMAICAGMASAAIVTGNTAIIKPASQSGIVAAQFVNVLRRAGLPDGVVNFVPGPGPEVGEYLVTSPDVDIIAFTGSRAVGTRIFERASVVLPGQDHLKKVIAEMGGKNALIIDSDADLDEAILGTIVSSFGYQGQKCSASSRIIVLDSIYDRFLKRLIEAARSLKIGPAEDPGSIIGPVIDEKAVEKIRGCIEIGKSEARLVLETEVSNLGDGFFIGPTVFADVPPTARIAQEEIFGPVVAVIRASDFDEAIKIAMNTDYCLTGGIYSRSPENIAKARREFRVGNLYINRRITGAIVGRQPFGGFKMSGIGSKAGGSDYLLQFMEPRTITENTLRRGFAPAD